MLVTRTINRTCTDPVACSDVVLTALGHNGTTRKLKAATRTDTVHGHVTIQHGPGAHLIEVEYYDAAEVPNARHATTHARDPAMPTRAAIEAMLDTLAN